MMPSRISKRSVVIENHKTSVSMEPEFWDCLHEIARDKRVTLSKLVSQIDTRREHSNLSSAIRLYVLETIQKKAEQGCATTSP